MWDEIIGRNAHRFSFLSGLPWQGPARLLHNDSPMYPAEPLRLMRSAVTRRTRSGEVLGEDQAIDVDAAIKALTIDAAWQLFMDDVVGSLEVGKLADLVILAENPRKVDADRLDKIRVIATYREGRRHG